MKLTIKLPWPPKECSPNARGHWSKRAKAAKAYRNECAYEALAWGAHKLNLPDGPIGLELAFYPPDRRKRDDDNIIASFKAGRDGLADALGIDDNRFLAIYRVDKQTGGFVVVTISSQVAA